MVGVQERWRLKGVGDEPEGDGRAEDRRMWRKRSARVLHMVAFNGKDGRMAL